MNSLPRLDAGRALHRARKSLRSWRDWWVMAGRLYPYVHKRRARFALAGATAIGYALVRLVEPWTIKLILDSVVLEHPVPGVLAGWLGSWGTDRIALLNVLVVAIVVIALLSGLLYYHQKLFAAQVGHRAVADLRLDLYRHLQGLCFAFHERRRTGDLLARLTSDIRFLREMFVSLPLSMLQELFLMLGMVAVMAWMDWSLTLLALTSVPAIAFLLHSYQGPMRTALRRQRDREGDIATTAAEVFGAIKVVQSFGRERKEADRFGASNKRSLRTGLKATRLEAKLRWYAEITVALVTAAVVAVAVRRVLSGALLPGDLIVFVAYLKNFNRPLRRVSRMAERSARGVAAGERVFAMLEVEPTVGDRPGARRARGLSGAIEFDGVSFQHRRGPRVLRDVSLRVEPGERLALVGRTGAGKSTMLSLIPRFYDPGRGAVRADGNDLRDLRLESLRAQIATVFQEPVLFATTVAENIGYGRPDATPEEVREAARRAGIHDVIEGLVDGYDTVLGERGGTLSGGQRQCVAIARALIKDAPIVLLDEPTAGLDAQSAAMVLAALETLMAGRTVVLVSHQLANIHSADRIVVLDRGRIVDQGTHATLVDADGLYGSLSRIQAEALPS